LLFANPGRSGLELEDSGLPDGCLLQEETGADHWSCVIGLRDVSKQNQGKCGNNLVVIIQKAKQTQNPPWKRVVQERKYSHTTLYDLATKNT
jgi:hypothetical protein